MTMAGSMSDSLLRSLFAEALEHQQAHRDEAARKLYRSILAARPEVWQAKSNLEVLAGQALARGVSQHQAGRLAEAMPFYRAVLEDFPDHVDALRLLGLAEWGTSKRGDGLRLLMRALAVEPGHAETEAGLRTVLGDLLAEAVSRQRDGRRAVANALYGLLLVLLPAEFSVLGNLATVLRELGRPCEAVSWRRRAAALNPSYPETLWALGLELFDAERWGEAAEAFGRVAAGRSGQVQAPFRRRVADSAADGATPAACQRNGLLALALHHYESWEPGPDLDCLAVPPAPVPASERVPDAYPYEVVENGAWWTRMRQATPAAPLDSRILTLGAATLLQAGCYADGVPLWHSAVLRRGADAGSFSGPPEMVNSYFSTLYVDTPRRRVFIDAAQVEPVSDPGSGPVLYLENWHRNYGHWMLDDLPRLLLMERAGVIEGCRLFIPWLASFQIKTLHELGLGDRLIGPTPWVRSQDYLYAHRFERLLLCTHPAMAEVVSSMRRAFLSRAAATGPRPERVLISRRKTSKTRMRNEARVADFLEARGFTVVAPETLSLEEQIALFANARIIVSATGSAYTNLVFARPGTTYLELTSRRVFEVMCDRFMHYDMFPQLEIRHLVMVFEALDEQGYDRFPVDSSFEVDLESLGRVVAAL